MVHNAENTGYIQNLEEVAILLVKHLREELTEGETHRFQSWVSQSDLNKSILKEITDKEKMTAGFIEYYNILNEVQKIQRRESDDRTRVLNMFSKKTNWPRYVAAASVLLVLTFGGYIFFNKKSHPLPNTPGTAAITPAGNKAILTLSNGSKIVLDNASNGVIAHQDQTIINKKQDGQLEYNSAASEGSPASYNLVSTPRGGKYQLILPDGSKVWLNAASSLRFPTAFTNDERKVELTGEAYFEIASSYTKGGDKKRPFIVSSNGTEVKVLGTHFNINAYLDEGEIKATLLEGSVQISSVNHTKEKLLKPGQQAILKPSLSDIRVIDKEEPDLAISWINEKFAFESTSFNTMMQELSRWYDVRVVYEGTVPKNPITGEIDRTINLSELLGTLSEMGNTKFKLEGRTVKVAAP